MTIVSRQSPRQGLAYASLAQRVCRGLIHAIAMTITINQFDRSVEFLSNAIRSIRHATLLERFELAESGSADFRSSPALTDSVPEVASGRKAPFGCAHREHNISLLLIQMGCATVVT